MEPARVNGSAALFGVHVVNGRTKNADEWAAEITDRLLSVAQTVPQPLRDQANAFKDQMFRVIRDNLELALKQEREWIINQTK